MNILHSPEETYQLGFFIGKIIEAGTVILLKGNLGCGKTTFSQGVASGLDVKESVTSPTFVILNEYLSGRLPLYHMDLYRLESIEELYDIGIEDYFDKLGVCLVEWPEIAEPLLPMDYICLTFSVYNDKRTVDISCHGKCDKVVKIFNEYFSD